MLNAFPLLAPHPLLRLARCHDHVESDLLGLTIGRDSVEGLWRDDDGNAARVPGRELRTDAVTVTVSSPNHSGWASWVAGYKLYAPAR